MAVHRLEDCPQAALKTPQTDWSLQGYSVAGERTGFWLEPLKVVLDAGLPTMRTPNAVFLTHKHTDHAAALPNILTKRRGPRPVFMPAAAYEPVATLQRGIRAMCDSDGHYDARGITDAGVYYRQGCLPRMVAAGDVFRIVRGRGKGKDIVEVEVLAAYHGDTEAVGYGFSCVKMKLRPEYERLKSTPEGKRQLAELGRSKVDITEEVLEPQFAFFCDSSIRNLTDHDEWKKYPVLTVECTVVEPDVPRRPQHTCLEELVSVIRDNREHQWILIHATARAFDLDLEERLQALGLEGVAEFWPRTREMEMEILSRE